MIPGKRTFLAALIVIVVAVPLFRSLVWSEYFPQGRASVSEIAVYIESLEPLQNPDDREQVEEKALGLAQLLYSDPSRCEEFASQLVDLYFELKEVDVVLIYNSAGVGYASIEDDPEWQGVMDGIQSVLSDMGYTSLIVEHRRTGEGALSFIWEMKEQLAGYPWESMELMAELEFLTKYDEDLIVIVTGRSTAEVFTNEVMKLVGDNERIYSIQAGRPFWYNDGVPDERALVISNNGLFLDALNFGDIVSIAFGTIFSSPFAYNTTNDGDLKVTVALTKAPGHHYYWELPGVCIPITEFLEENFGGDS